MKIAVFVPAFPVLAETFILRQTTQLIDLGHDVDIYAEWHVKGAPIHREVTAYQLEARATYVGVLPNNRLVRWTRTALAAPRDLITAPRATLHILSRDYGTARVASLHWLAGLRSRRKAYDVLHVHFGTLANRLRFVTRFWRAPLVVSFWGLEFHLGSRSGREVYRRVFTAADMVTAASEHAMMRLREFGCSAQKMYKLRGGIDPHQFSFQERILRPGQPVRLLTIARLVEKKGLEYAIRAVAAVAREYSNIRYDIVGGNGLRARLQGLIEELGLSEIVTLHGPQEGEYVRNLLGRAHLFVLPSVTAAGGDQETQGVAIIEAQASGLPVVVTRHNGFPESIAPGVSGFLVPERDTQALAERIRYLIANPELWPQMGRAGRQYVEQCFNVRTLTDHLVRMYEELAARRRRP